MTNLFPEIETDDIAEAVNAIANPLDHLVGEGKKFKTPEDLAKGKLYSDLYVDKVLATAKAEKERADQIEAELAALKSRATETLEMVNNEAAKPQSSEQKNDVTNDTKEIDLDRVVEEKISSIRAAEKRQANLEFVQKKLLEKFGENYVEEMNKLGEEYGKEYLINMAQDNPKAFLRLAAPSDSSQEAPRATKPSTNLFAPPANSVNVAAKMTNTNVKGHKYYHELRRQDPRKFNSPEIYRERLAAMTALGDEYFKH